MLLQSTSFLLHCNPKNGFCLSLQGVSEDVRKYVAGLAGIQAGRSETQSPGTETLLPKGSIREHGEFLFCGACGSTICGTMEGRPSLFLTAGVFSETDWILPVAHLWKGSAQKWLQRSAGTLDVF